MHNKSISIVSGAISVTGTCTIACKHCYSESGPKIQTTHSYETLIELIQSLHQHGVGQIFIGGGEPLLHPQLANIIKYMFDLGVLPSISTNGHVISEQHLQNLYDAGLRYNFSVSLDGPLEYINDKLRGRNSFTRTLHGMYKLAEFGRILWGVNYVSCRPNLGFALETAQLTARLGGSYFNCIKFTPSGRGERYATELSVTHDEYQNEIFALAGSYTAIGEYFNDIYVFDVRDCLDGKSFACCARSYFDDFSVDNPLGISINHNGDVALAPPNIPLGNLNTGSLGAILTNLSSADVLSKYDLWLNGRWNGIHPPREADRTSLRIER